MHSFLAADEPAAALTTFEREVAPLLAGRCLDCHNSSDKKGGLDLSRRDTVMAGGESGAVIEPGDPDASTLWVRIEGDEMPPKHPLSAEKKAIIRQWIADGAVWSGAEIDRFRYSSDTRAGYDWWSLQPVVRPAVPVLANETWSRNDVDRLIHIALREKGLEPAAAADRRTLIRRLSFDLTGLPPAPEEIDAFVADSSADAYEKLVDRLLASPQFGVRWARHWLDVVRFGESNGFEYDEFRPDAWPYRDWVVDALNADMPYDEFVRAQLAGDVFHPGEREAKIATAFLTAGPYDTAGQVQQSAAMKAVVRQDELEDLVGTVGQSFLGLTVNCARCHDHKFDPIRQQEYFALVAALSGVRHGKIDLAGLHPTGSHATRLAEWDERRQQLRDELAALEKPVRERLEGQTATISHDLRPLAAWDFTETVSASEDKLTLHGAAQRTVQGLQLDGQTGYATSEPFEVALREKSLEIWVRLANVDQRGGGAITVQSLDGVIFDSIVFGERDPRHWLAGSNNFARTQGFNGPAETASKADSVHLAITYGADGTIAAYRDGRPYGGSYRAESPASFGAKKWQVVFGLRHSPVGPGKHLSGTIERARLYDRALTADEVAASSGRHVTIAAIRAQLNAADRARHERLATELTELSAARDLAFPLKLYGLAAQQPEPTRLLARGNPAQPLDTVAPGGVAAVPGSPANFGLAADAPESERRRQLAKWITDPANPLFARVIVNRLWHYHFGIGLVDTPNDLGFNGGRPANRALLDWLAAELVAQNYRLKPLHRLIVTSAAYRQQSRQQAQAMQLDADNRLLWRKSPVRLEAEAVRDAMLATAGVLDTHLGGPGFQEMKIVIAPGTGTFLYAADDPTRDDFKRRTLYRVWARSGRSPLLDAFDCPDPSTTSPKRAVTTTPLQALALMNNSFVLHLTDNFVERVRRQAGDAVPDQVDLAYRLALGRTPDAAERAAATEAVGLHGLSVLARALFNSNEFVYVD